MCQRVRDALAEDDFRDSRELITAHAEDHHLAAQFRSDKADGLLQLVGEWTTDMLTPLIVSGLIVWIPHDLDIGLAQGHLWICEQMQRAGHGQVTIRCESDLLQALFRSRAGRPSIRLREAREQVLLGVAKRDVRLRRFEPRRRALVDETLKIGAKEGIVPTASADEHAAVRGLRESFLPARDRHRCYTPPLYVQMVDRVSTEIVGGTEGAVDRVCCSRVHPPALRDPVVSDADQEHAALRVRKRNRSVLNRPLASAGFELDVLALARELAGKVVRRQRQRDLATTSRMKKRICQCCSCARVEKQV